MIAIIDYNVGNLYNLKNALDFQDIPCRIVRTPAEAADATHMILPGVGAFRPAMEHLRQSGMIPLIEDRVGAGMPFLGVCVGLQLLYQVSEEDGEHAGLGLLPGRIVRFVGGNGHKVPQIGWNQVAWQRADPLNTDIPDASYFYFVHSYHVQTGAQETVLGSTEYGEVFPSVVQQGNVWGVQFHPEKSQNAGLRLLRNFAEIPPGPSA